MADLDQIRARWAAATPAQWRYGASVAPPGGTLISVPTGALGPDAEAILRAPEDIAALLAEVDRLRATTSRWHSIREVVERVAVPLGMAPADLDDDAIHEILRGGSDAADQLRAAGERPTHARLEWADNRLYLCMDSTRFVVVTYLLPACDVLFHPGFSEWHRCYSRDAMLAAITAWHAAHLPSLHLPPFPEPSNAS